MKPGSLPNNAPVSKYNNHRLNLPMNSEPLKRHWDNSYIPTTIVDPCSPQHDHGKGPRDSSSELISEVDTLKSVTICEVKGLECRTLHSPKRQNKHIVNLVFSQPRPPLSSSLVLRVFSQTLVPINIHPAHNHLCFALKDQHLFHPKSIRDINFLHSRRPSYT